MVSGCLFEPEYYLRDIRVLVLSETGTDRVDFNLSEFNIPNIDQENLTLSLSITINSKDGRISYDNTTFTYNESSKLFEAYGHNNLHSSEFRNEGGWGPYLRINEDKGNFDINIEFTIIGLEQTYYLFNNTNRISINAKIIDQHTAIYTLKNNYDNINLSNIEGRNKTIFIGDLQINIHIEHGGDS